MSLDHTDDKSTLVQVMAWCCQATSHYLSQCWPTGLPYRVTWPQWVNSQVLRSLWEKWLSFWKCYFHKPKFKFIIDHQLQITNAKWYIYVWWNGDGEKQYVIPMMKLTCGPDDEIDVCVVLMMKLMCGPDDEIDMWSWWWNWCVVLMIFFLYDQWKLVNNGIRQWLGAIRHWAST